MKKAFDSGNETLIAFYKGALNASLELGDFSWFFPDVPISDRHEYRGPGVAGDLPYLPVDHFCYEDNMKRRFAWWMELRNPDLAWGSEARLQFFGIYVGAWLVVVLVVKCLSSGAQGLEEAWAEAAPGSRPSRVPDLKESVGAEKPRPPLTVVDLFFQHADKTPQRVALVAWTKGQRVEIRYGDLAGRVRRMAKQLFELGVRSGDRVILRIHRGVHQIVAVYATMAAGAVFVPVDPDVPNTWLDYVLQDSEAALLVEEEGVAVQRREASPSSAESPGAAISRVAAVEASADGSPLRLPAGGEVSEAADELPQVKLEQPACIFYTSGSTGRPKGVLHNHAQLQNAAMGIAEDAHVGPESVALLRSPAVWSTYEWEAFPALMQGGVLVVAEPLGHKDPAYLAHVLDAESVHMIAITPKSLDLVLDVVEQRGLALPHLKDVASTGEQLPVSLANRFVRLLPHARLHNGYNPTESAACTWYTVPPTGLDSKLYPTNVPAGLPQPGVSVYVMGPDLQRLAEGEEGEILFGGLLSQGYWRRPELNVEKFVKTKEFGRLYHSGDKGKWDRGLLCTMGRIDRQVKIRGVRVEPEEVEAVLGTHWRDLRHSRQESSVAGAGVCCVSTLSEPAELVAFVAPTASPAELDSLKDYCLAQLPLHYVPTHFFSLEKLPALPVGKVDVKALQAQATELVQQSVAEVADSMGVMKKLTQGALMESQVINRCYTVFMLGVIIDHSMQCFLDMGGFCGELAVTAVEPWAEMLVRSVGVGGQQAMIGFLMLGGWADSRPEPGSQKSALALHMKDVTLLLVFVAMHWPIPRLFLPLIGVGVEYVVELGGYMGSIGWLLPVLLVSRVLVWASQKLGIPGWLLTTVMLAMCWRPAWCLPDRDISPGTGTVLDTLQLGDIMTFPHYLCYHFIAYIAGYNHGRDILRKLGPQLPTGPVWGAAAFALSWIFGMWVSIWHYPMYWMQPNIVGVSMDMNWEFLMCAIQPILLAFGMVHFPVDLSFWGNATLGAYIFHIYFVRHIRWVVQQIVPAVKWDHSGVLLFVGVVGTCFALQTALSVAGKYVVLLPQLLWARARALLLFPRK